ncbi:MAG: hypothetical protein PHD20_02430, partial [Clostridia bacterium]|nr:hypothetical protein [Clostridia bacterium]
METKQKKGISLIVLVITIIIMIILAGTIILSLTGSGIIEKAKEAKFRSNAASLNEMLQLELLNGKKDLKISDFTNDKDVNKKFVIIEDKLVYVGANENEYNIAKNSSIKALKKGTGTETDPYIVATAEDLYNVRNDLKAYYMQVCDINISKY